MKHTEKNTMKAYIVGFALSLILTFGAYFSVTEQLFQGGMLMTVLLILAFVQLVVQLWFFLHLGREKSPRWQLYFFLATVGMILLVVLASIWIMQHLNYNMTPSRQSQQIIIDEGIKK